MSYPENTTLASKLLSSPSTKAPLTEGHHIPFVFSMITVNAVIALVAISLNLLIILTFVKTSALRQTPSNVFVLGLAIVDFAVGIFSQPTFCIRLFFQFQNYGRRIYQTTNLVYNLSFTLQLFASLGILTAITADRFLATHLHLRYQQVVTSRRCGMALAFVGFASILLSLPRFKGLNGEKTSSLFMLPFYIVVIGGIVSTNGIFIFKISRVIHRHSIQIQAQQQSVQQSIDMPGYKRSVNTMYFLIGGFVWSYLFLVAVLVVYAVIKKSQEMDYLFLVTETIMMFNGVLNPLIYCIRVQEIRRAAALRYAETFFVKVFNSG